jgi:hypothetical protein
MQAIRTETIGQYVIKIFPDCDANSPREDDCLGTIYHAHSRYDLGERMDIESIEAIVNDPKFITLPVYMYEHSNIALNTGSFGCAWDSGQVGIIAVEKSKVLKEWNRRKWSKKLENQVLKSLKAEVEVYSSYLSGEVYGFVIEKPSQCGECKHVENERIDSCWGFIGDMEYCLSEARLNVPSETKPVTSDTETPSFTEDDI